MRPAQTSKRRATAAFGSAAGCGRVSEPLVGRLKPVVAMYRDGAPGRARTCDLWLRRPESADQWSVTPLITARRSGAVPGAPDSGREGSRPNVQSSYQ